MKFEKKNNQYNRNGHSQLRHEFKVYKEIHSKGKVKGFPYIYNFGASRQGNLLILDLLGPSLNILLDACNGKFTLKQTIYICDQTLQRLETLHNHNLIHRDVKPDNFAIGLTDNQIYCIDLGLTQSYCDRLTKNHKPYVDTKSLVGTPRYASINVHKGITYGRRDDLQSLAYTLIYLIKGSLPWQGIDITDKKEKYKKILEKKESISSDELCEGLPKEFSIFLQYTKDLKFDEKPNYSYLRGLFHSMYTDFNYHLTKIQWDWNIKPSIVVNEKTSPEVTYDQSPISNDFEDNYYILNNNKRKSSNDEDDDDDNNDILSKITTKKVKFVDVNA